MVAKELTEYIRKARKSNLSDNQIRYKLVTGGWPAEDVDHALIQTNDPSLFSQIPTRIWIGGATVLCVLIGLVLISPFISAAINSFVTAHTPSHCSIPFNTSNNDILFQKANGESIKISSKTYHYTFISPCTLSPSVDPSQISTSSTIRFFNQFRLKRNSYAHASIDFLTTIVKEDQEKINSVLVINSTAVTQVVINKISWTKFDNKKEKNTWYVTTKDNIMYRFILVYDNTKIPQEFQKEKQALETMLSTFSMTQ